MPDHKQPDLRDVMQWEVRSWGRALPLWERHLPVGRPARALGLGERGGGLSLWMAAKGFEVVCTDLNPFPKATSELHERYGVQDRISYRKADVTALPFPDGCFHVVFFKSVIGALGSKEKQALAIREMHRVLVHGGVLLFAENLTGTPLHRFLRKHFVSWENYWRYPHPVLDKDLFAPFARVELASTGFLANLGRSEGQRDLLARMDVTLAPLVAPAWRTIWYGAAVKA
jgi:ubiquinone/menaquinone biosynthesis C-methylase UbiE